MAQKKKRSNSKLKKQKSTVSVVIACLVILIALFVGIKMTSDNEPSVSPEISSSENPVTTESTSVENSTEKASETETSGTTTETTTKEITTDGTTKEQETIVITTKPLTGSFYDAVKYRSPDAVPADIFKHGRTLMLLNRQYELPEDFKWDLVYWSNGQYVDAMYLNCEEHNTVKAVDPRRNPFAGRFLPDLFVHSWQHRS